MASSFTSSNLDTLPAEIIKRIATFSTTPSVLSLLLVNQRLRDVCNDHAVFKAIILHQNNLNLSPIHAQKSQDQQPWNLPPTINSSEVTASQYARYALADFKAREWKELPRHGLFLNINTSASDEKALTDAALKNLVSKDGFPKYVDWAPQLAALHHPFTLDLNILSTFRIFRRNSATGEISTLFSWFRPAPNSKNTNNHTTKSSTHHGALDFLLKHAMLAQFHASRQQQKRSSISSSSELFTPYHLIAQHLRSIAFPNFDSNRLVNPTVLALELLLYSERKARTVSIPLPSPFKIPFPTIMRDLALPFSNSGSGGEGEGGGDVGLEKSHLEVMTSKAFLESGEWVGYYSYNTSLLEPTARWDPPMQGIKLTATSTNDAGNGILDGSVVKINGSGSDRVGRFTLEGGVLKSGEVLLRKYYDQGFWWKWNARMTPFGIVGVWGGEEAWNRERGCLWIWKREWSCE